MNCKKCESDLKGKKICPACGTFNSHSVVKVNKKVVEPAIEKKKNVMNHLWIVTANIMFLLPFMILLIFLIFGGKGMHVIISSAVAILVSLYFTIKKSDVEFKMKNILVASATIPFIVVIINFIGIIMTGLISLVIGGLIMYLTGFLLLKILINLSLSLLVSLTVCNYISKIDRRMSLIVMLGAIVVLILI